MVNEEYQEKRFQQQLARATTDPQRDEMRRLNGLNKDVYPEPRQGKGVVAEFRRYVDTRNPDKIGQGLYRLLTGGAGGFNEIAHFDIYGFRAVYPHPLVMIEGLIRPEVERWPQSYRDDPDGYHSFYVYTDGLHAGDVAHQIVGIATERREELVADWRRLEREKDESELRRLAKKLGIEVSL